MIKDKKLQQFYRDFATELTLLSSEEIVPRDVIKNPMQLKMHNTMLDGLIYQNFDERTLKLCKAMYMAGITAKQGAQFVTISELLNDMDRR